MSKHKKFMFMVGSLMFLTVGAAPYTVPSAQAAQKKITSLHRADFQITGVSCPVCLRKITTALKGTPGVFEADVAMKKPHWAIVIYDAQRVSFPKLSCIVKQASTNKQTAIAEVHDRQITKVPDIVLPGMD